MKIRARTSIAAAALAVALPLLAAERLAVKTGLWESNVTTEVSDVKLPKEQIDRLTPEQRVRLEQVMKQMGIGAPVTNTGSSCITEKDLDGNAFRDAFDQATEDCEYQQLSATSTRQEWTFRCPVEGGEASGRMRIDAVDDGTVRGSMQATLPQARMDIRFEAKWQAAACPPAD